MAVAALPEFVNPPVNETVLSIQFAPLTGFLIPHFGLYWSRIRSEYPECQVLPEIDPVIEQFGGNPTRAKFGFQMVLQAALRYTKI